MVKPYGDMYALFRHEPEAEAYFNTLPDHVREQISSRYRAVDSLPRLQAYADRLLQQSVIG